MTWDDFDQFRSDLINESNDVADVKAKSYAGKDDRLANFKRNATRFAADPKLVLGVYLNKHWDSIERWIGEGVEPSEGIRATIKDAIQYLVMLAALDEEEKSS